MLISKNFYIKACDLCFVAQVFKRKAHCLLCIIFIISLANHSKAQKGYLVIENIENGEPVAFCTVMVGDSIFYADEWGIIARKKFSSNHVCFSAVGFHRQCITINDKQETVLLHPEAVDLDEITISANTGAIEEVGFHNAKSNQSTLNISVFSGSRHDFIYGVFIDNPGEQTRLEEIIVKLAHDLDSRPVRLYCFEASSVDSIGDLIWSELFHTKVQRRKQHFKPSLKPTISGRGFVIGISTNIELDDSLTADQRENERKWLKMGKSPNLSASVVRYKDSWRPLLTILGTTLPTDLQHQNFMIGAKITKLK